MASVAVQVNDATGNALTKVMAGITVKDALSRIRLKGRLEDSAGIARLDEEIISVAGEPYVFIQTKSSDDNEMADVVAAVNKRLSETLDKNLDQHLEKRGLDKHLSEKLDGVLDYIQAQQAVNKNMSEASFQFATDLLFQRGIRVVSKAPCSETVKGVAIIPFNWMIATTDGRVLERTEVEATPDFRDWLQKEWLGNEESSWSIERVTGESLPKVQAGDKSATGKADLCVGDKVEMGVVAQNQAPRLPHCCGIVEIKRSSANSKPAQMVLEVVSLSLVSRFQKGVVLLGTDGCAKWCIVHFSKHNEVSQQYFSNGRRCLAEYESMLHSSFERGEELTNAELEEMSSKKPKFSSVPENAPLSHGGMEDPATRLSVASAARGAEQDLTGFEDVENDMRDKAIEVENFLRRLAETLGDLAGGGDEHRPTLPEWALAKNRIPSYFDDAK
jgi:hypothetical protein